MNHTDDLLHRFVFDDTDIRGEVVSIKHSLAALLKTRDYPTPIKSLLGEFLAASSLLSSILKFEGKLTLQARGEGDLSIIMAEISHHKKIRAVAEFNPSAELSDRSLGSLLGSGILSIIIDPDKGEKYQGIVELNQETLAGCLESYFLQSEQLPTKLWISSNGDSAGGIMLQRLPQQIADAASNDDAWETQTHLANTLSDEEVLNLSHETLLTRLFHETGVRMFEPEHIHFSCSCSKERSSLALKRLGQSELMEIVNQDGKITVDCHFCGFRYDYYDTDIKNLFKPEIRH